MHDVGMQQRAGARLEVDADVVQEDDGHHAVDGAAGLGGGLDALGLVGGGSGSRGGAQIGAVLKTRLLGGLGGTVIGGDGVGCHGSGIGEGGLGGRVYFTRIEFAHSSTPSGRYGLMPRRFNSLSGSSA